MTNKSNELDLLSVSAYLCIKVARFEHIQPIAHAQLSSVYDALCDFLHNVPAAPAVPSFIVIPYSEELWRALNLANHSLEHIGEFLIW